MRKNELRRFANNQLNGDKRGSHRDRKHRLFVINKVIHDLFKIGNPPSQWYGLEQSHIQALVSLWKKQAIKTVTIMKYMTCLRYFLHHIEHTIIGIDNQTLGLSRRIKHTTRTQRNIEPLPHPIAHVLIQLQTTFGLTFTEATKVIPDIHIREHTLWMTREITFNSQDRVIPTRDGNQLTILQSLRELTQNHQSLISAHGYDAILYIYRVTMKSVGLDSKKSYRYLYAKKQFDQLSPLFSRHEVIGIIMREMGFKSRTTLWNYLHE